MVFAAVKMTAQGNAPETKRNRKHSEDIKGIKLKICRRAKNYGTIRQAVQRRTPVPVRFEFRLVPLLLWWVLERRGVAEPLV